MVKKIYIEPPESERKFRRLAALGKELGIPIPQAFLEIEVKMPDGKILTHFKQRAHSWVRNAYNLLLSEMACKDLDSGVGAYGPGELSIKDTAAGVQRGSRGAIISAGSGAFSFEGAGQNYRANAGIATHGIQVGSDNTVFSFEDYKLVVPIIEGTGAQQLSHAAMAAPTKSYGALTWAITWMRFFNNNTLAATDVLVKEVGLITAGYIVSAPINWLNSRDVLGATVTIPSTGQLKVTYAISLVYPA